MGGIPLREKNPYDFRHHTLTYICRHTNTTHAQVFTHAGAQTHTYLHTSEHTYKLCTAGMMNTHTNYTLQLQFPFHC